MADAKLRALERRFSDEGDLAAGRELAASLRRAGAPVCGPLLAADVRPGLSFASELPLGVHVLTGDDEVRWLGNTPRPNPLEVPEHRAWWVQPLRSEAEHLRRAVEALRAQGIPGLAVGGRGANGLIPPLPTHLETLRLQRRVVGRGELDFADADPPLVVPNLTRLSLDGAGSVEVDPGEALTEVALSGAEQACRELVERFAGRGLPLTRLDLRAFRELDLGEAAWARLPALRELRVETGVFGCPVEAELAHLERLDLDVMLARDLEPLLARTSATVRHLRYTGALGALDALAPLSQLRSLVLGRSARPSPRVLAELECWGRLERLGFSGNLQVGWAEAVVAARSLRELNLDAADRWPAEAYQALQRLPALETLSLRGEPGTGSAWLPLLAGLPLRALHYRGGAEPDFDAFPALPALRRLNLEVAGAEWSAEQLLRLLEPGELEELELGGALVPAAVLEALPELQPRLRVLRVHGEQVSDTTLSALGRLRELRELDLLGVEPQDVSQAGWKRLLEAPVERLRLGIEPPSTSWRQALRFTLHALRGNLDLGW